MKSALPILLACIALPALGAEPPRLTGLLVAPGQRTALFDTGSGIASVEEGESVGEYVVRRIGPTGVEVERAGEMTMLQPGRAARSAPVDDGGATFGLALRPQPPIDD